MKHLPAIVIGFVALLAFVVAPPTTSAATWELVGEMGTSDLYCWWGESTFVRADANDTNVWPLTPDCPSPDPRGQTCTAAQAGPGGNCKWNRWEPYNSCLVETTLYHCPTGPSCQLVQTAPGSCTQTGTHWENKGKTYYSYSGVLGLLYRTYAKINQPTSCMSACLASSNAKYCTERRVQQFYDTPANQYSCWGYSRIDTKVASPDQQVDVPNDPGDAMVRTTTLGYALEPTVVCTDPTFVCAGPDITVGSVTPTTAVATSLKTLTATVTNRGTQSAGGTFSNHFQFDTDTNHSTGVTSQADTTVSPNLAKNTTDPTSVNHTFPTSGTWYVRACADYLDDIDEGGNEANNCGDWTPITVAAAPFSVSCTRTPAGAVAVGQNVTWRATVSPATPAGITTRYSWSGSEGLSGSASTAVIAYTVPGTKNASVSVIREPSAGAGAGTWQWGVVDDLSGGEDTSCGGGTRSGLGTERFNTCPAGANPGNACTTYGDQCVRGGSTSGSSGGTCHITTLRCGLNQPAPAGAQNVVISCPALVIAGSDLTATVSPTTATVGTPKTFSASISNSGTAATSVGFNNVWQVASSSDGTGAVNVVSSTGALDGTPTVALGISSRSVSSNDTYTFPSSAAGQTRYYRACADLPPLWTGVIVERDDSDNCGAWTAVTVGGTPDLTVSDVSANPQPATVGAPVTLSATVTSATAGTGVGFTNLFQRATNASGANATDIGTNASPALAAGGSDGISIQYTFPAPPSGNTWYVRACADKSSAASAGTIAESNEGNNCGTLATAWEAITVNPSQLSCDVDSQNVVTDTQTTYRASGGSGYTWTQSGQTNCSGSANRTCTFENPGRYTMRLTAGGSTINCPWVDAAPSGLVCGSDPQLTLTASEERVKVNTGPLTLTWDISDTAATSCTLVGVADTGAQVYNNSITISSCDATGASATVYIPTRTLFTLTCGSDTATVDVKVDAGGTEF